MPGPLAGTQWPSEPTHTTSSGTSAARTRSHSNRTLRRSSPSPPPKSIALQVAEEWDKGSGVTRSEVWVTATNEAAVHFYESLDHLPTDDTQTLREGVQTGRP